MKVTEELIRLRKHREALEAFIKSAAHTGYVSARQEELRMVNEEILETDPKDIEDMVSQLMLRGEKRVLENLAGIFPIALDELNDRIGTLEDDDFKGVKRSNATLE